MSNNGPAARHQLRAEIKAATCRNGICTLTMAAPPICRVATAGQFIMVRVAGENCNDPLLSRPFSIHRISGELLTLVFKVVGRGTRLLSQLREKDELEVFGPLGKGFRIGEEAVHYLVGGGMGIAPLHMLAESIRNKQSKPEVIALLGARTAAELEAFDSFTHLKKLQVRIATDDGSAGYHGLVTGLLADTFSERGAGAVYCCGPLPMMQTVARFCKERKLACQVSLETMMACAVGACLGCAVKKPAHRGKGYLHVCQDGPVFAAEEIW